MPSIDDELSQIERDIRTLKIEYEQFFGGGRKRPPTDTQWRVDSLIRRCGERMGELTYGQRFRYNNLTQTYAKYQDMWRKKLMQKESGSQQRHFGAAAKAIESTRHHNDESVSRSLAQVPANNPHPQSSDSERNSVFEHSQIEELYGKLIAARQRTGEQAGTPSLADFKRFVQQKTRDLKEKGAQQVDFTVAVEGGRVRLKARIEN